MILIAIVINLLRVWLFTMLPWPEDSERTFLASISYKYLQSICDRPQLYN